MDEQVLKASIDRLRSLIFEMTCRLEDMEELLAFILKENS